MVQYEGHLPSLPDLPQPVVGNAPDAPTVFTDGSFSTPRYPSYSLSSAGIWWPQRTLIEQPLTQLEGDYTISKQTSDGVELLTFTQGSSSSSSRTELLGLNAALFSGVPFFAALDSSVVLRTAQAILDYLSLHDNLLRHRARLPQSVADLPTIPTLRRQLAFMPNSDYWLIFWRAVVSRGVEGIRLKKTKGHALEPHNRQWLADHPELRGEAIHNKRADRLADDARERFFHPNVRRLSTILVERHKQYVVFVRAIMAIIGRVHIVSQELRRAQTAIGQHLDRSLPNTLTFKPLWYDHSLHYHGLQFTCSQSMLSIFLSRHASAAIVSPFAKLLMFGRFAHTQNSSGLTWLELFILSISFADNPMSLLRSSTAQAQKPIARQLREFIAAASDFVKFALTPNHQAIFRASTKQPNRLAAFGYYNRVAHTCAHIFIGRETQSKLHLVMLALKAPLTRDQHEAYTANNLVIKAQKFVGHHLYHGGSAIAHLALKLKAELRSACCSLAQAPDQPCCNFCPQGHARSSTNQFCALNTTKSIWCFNCKGSHSATSWTCQCGVVWHQCHAHFSACMTEQTDSHSSVEPRRGIKRPVAASSSASAKRLARLEPSIASRLCLSPGLAARFPHLVSGEPGSSSGGLPQGNHCQAQSPTASPTPPLDFS